MKKKDRDFMTMQNIMMNAVNTEVNCEGESYAIVDVKNNLVEVSHEPSHSLMPTWSDYLSCDDVIKIANLIKKIRRENV